MKKLMFAAAAIAAGVAVADVTSANVVGYTTHKLWGNNYITWSMATVQDMANTAEEQTIGSFKIPTDQMFGSGDSIKFEIWGNNGQLVGAYSFVDEMNCITYSLTNPGWYPLELMQQWLATDADLMNDKVSIDAGQMVVITSGEADTTLTIPDPMKVTPPAAE